VDSFLLKGSSLQRTEWIYGVAVYTGHESKLMKNSSSSKNKKSDVEKKTDMYILLTAGI
jgi:phospholipid-transporting ATPase